jgi:hypothetical protein
LWSDNQMTGESCFMSKPKHTKSRMIRILFRALARKSKFHELSNYHNFDGRAPSSGQRNLRRQVIQSLWNHSRFLYQYQCSAELSALCPKAFLSLKLRSLERLFTSPESEKVTRGTWMWCNSELVVVHNMLPPF